MRAALVLLALLAAGCVDVPGEDPAPPGSPAAPVEVPVTLEGCLVIEGLAVVPASAVEGQVPAAFRVAASPDGTVRVALGGFSCPGGNASGLFAIPVTPQDDRLRHAAVDRSFWRPEVHVADGSPLALAYQRLRATVTPVEEVLADDAPAGGAFVVQAEGWRHRVAYAPGAAAPVDPRTVAGVFREYSAADGGVAYLQAEFLPTAASRFGAHPALLEAGESTPARQALGARAAGTAFVLTDATYADARLGYVPLPPI